MRINLGGLDDEKLEIVARHDKALAHARQLGGQVADAVEIHLGSHTAG